MNRVVATLSLGEGDNTMEITLYSDGGAIIAVCDNGVQNMHFDAEPEDVRKILIFFKVWRVKCENGTGGG